MPGYGTQNEALDTQRYNGYQPEEKCPVQSQYNWETHKMVEQCLLPCEVFLDMNPLQVMDA